MDDSFFTFSNLAQFPELFHGVSKRLNRDGARFNFGEAFDAPETIRIHERMLLSNLGVPPELPFVKVFQMHEAEVLILKTWKGPSTRLFPADALETDVPGLALSVRIADCQGVLMYDPVKRAVAAVHSGWRGSVQNIMGRAVAALKQTFGTQPSDLWVGVSPSLGPCCARFTDPDRELPEFVLRHRVDAHRVDFWALTAKQLSEGGVDLGKVEFARECTACHTDRWFSHRGDQTHEMEEGRMVAVIGLRDTTLVSRTGSV